MHASDVTVIGTRAARLALNCAGVALLSSGGCTTVVQCTAEPQESRLASKQ